MDLNLVLKEGPYYFRHVLGLHLETVEETLKVLRLIFSKKDCFGNTILKLTDHQEKVLFFQAQTYGNGG